MMELYRACRALYETAFGGADDAWNDALFRHVMPDCLRVIAKDEKPQSMLFSIPYAICEAGGTREARYLYAVATDPDCRGQGLATALLSRVIAEGYPVFLRPSSPSLFAFYQNAGLLPVSPVLTEVGAAAESCAGTAFLSLTPGEYLSARAAFLKPPFATPTEDFLSLGYLTGGALGVPGEFVAFYERRGTEVCFKEWLGNLDFAPRAAAFLGAARYELRTPSPTGTPFGVAANCPEGLTFLIALD
ncbi:MAG: GNAT family N-acetyltransferase [Clostridia bacterium]|nr:GNAT family N-acetyltransferase [Clostridia bacterium]